jgi:hypothetical protein
MLRNALEFLTDELNSWLQRKDPVNFQEGKTVILSNLMKPDGTFAVNSNAGQGNDKFNIVITLINIEEERVAESQYYYRRENDKLKVVNPPLNLNLLVMFSAVADKYATALTLLDNVLLFFQGHQVFDESTHPALNAKVDPTDEFLMIKRMAINLHSLSLEQQNNLWAALGAKYMPSAIYKIRTLTLTDVEPKTETVPITEININQ